MHLRIDPITFTSARPENQDVYVLLWSGSRANYGVRDGKVCFEVYISDENNLSSNHEFHDEPYIRGFRVGFSLSSTSLMLGETKHSFAYCESGRKATDGEFTNYAKSYKRGDVIGCYLDLDSNPCNIKYTLNGKELGVAFEFEKSILEESEDKALFPHILTKGYGYQVNFADNDNLLLQKVAENTPSKKDRTIKSADIKLSDDKTIIKDTKTKTSEDGNLMNMDIQETKSLHKGEEENKSNDETKCLSDIGEVKCQEEENEIENESNMEQICETSEAESTNISEEPLAAKRLKLSEIDVKIGKEDLNAYDKEEPEVSDSLSLLNEYELIALIPEEKYISGPQRPATRKDCEVILMVGLPGSGKTTWVLNHLRENPLKRYYVIGADSLISKMTVSIILNQLNYFSFNINNILINY